MSFDLIKEGLNKINNITSWSAFLISYNHKSHPNEYVCYNMNFATDELLKSTISSMSASYLKIVESYDKKVLNYTGTNPKNTVDKLSVDNPLIKNCWQFILEHINNSDDTTKLEDIKAKAYIFVGTYTNNDQSHNIYLLTRRNPIINYKKRHLFTSKNNTIAKSKDPLIQFSKSFDALIYNNIIYMINSNCESIFNMEYSHKIICEKCLSELEISNLIDNIENYKKYALHGQTPKKFITYNPDIIKKLKLTKYREELSKELNIPLNSETKKFDLNDETHAKHFTLAICGKTKFNMFDKNICEVPSSTPLHL